MRVGELIRGIFERRPTERSATTRDRPSRVGTPAAALCGATPDGAPTEMALDGPPVALLFLTSSCYGCQVLWEGIATSVRPVGDPTVHPSIVVVTPSASTESARRIAALASGAVEVVMSSDSWHAYDVTKAPWYVMVAGGLVVADGPAPSTWDRVETLVGRGR